MSTSPPSSQRSNGPPSGLAIPAPAVSRSTPPPLPESATEDAQPAATALMLDRLSHGDYAGALLTAEAILGHDATHRDAAQTRAMCRSELRKLYVHRLGALDRVPHIATSANDLLRLQLDYRAGFVLSRVDGLATLDEIATLDGAPSFTALRILSELYLHRVIDFHR